LVEVDAGTAADNRLEVTLTVIDLDLRAGVAAVLLGDLVGLDGLDLVGVVLAEGVFGGHVDDAPSPTSAPMKASSTDGNT